VCRATSEQYKAANKIVEKKKKEKRKKKRKNCKKDGDVCN
jgi:hypothetical protein